MLSFRSLIVAISFAGDGRPLELGLEMLVDDSAGEISVSLLASSLVVSAGLI
jgi:hypothetical protein